LIKASLPSLPDLAVGTRSRPVATLLWAGVTLREATKRIGALLALAAACAAWPLSSFAQENTPAPPPANAPGLLVSPTYILLDGRTRSQALLLSNRGAAPETYRITIVNRLQKSDGQLVDTDKPGEGEGFASTIVRYAPREVTLPPDKPQTVRLLLQMPANLPDGEYRSHILFQQIPTAKPTDDVSTTVAPGLSVTIRAVFGVTIPLIVRKGALTAGASLSDLKLLQLADEQPGISFHLNRTGTRSLHGDLVAQVDGTAAGLLKNVNVFLSTPYRELVIPLSTKGDLKGHRISVQYTEDDTMPGAASTAQTLSP
jgi:P pilus assembly chaperone PapD